MPNSAKYHPLRMDGPSTPPRLSPLVPVPHLQLMKVNAPRLVRVEEVESFPQLLSLVIRQLWPLLPNIQGVWWC